MKFFILFSFIAKESLCQRGCYLSILDKSRLVTCVDERGGLSTDFSAWMVEHATVCTYTHCNTLQHIECTDGSWVYVAHNDDGLEIDPLICDEASLLARKHKRVKKFFWGWFWSSSPDPPPPPPPPNCGMPGNVRGASVSVTSTQLGGIATYTCNLGYGYTGGDLTRTCQSSAQWSGTEPVCVYMNSCNSFPCKNGGTCTNNPESYMCSCPDIWKGTNCEQEAYVCARNPCVNYVRCEDGGTIYTCVCKPGWSGQTCNTPIDCGDPGLIVNGIVTAPETTLGNVATYSCNDGYNATIGNKERICNTDGKWSGQPLVCKYASSCSSSPCMNKASCTNLIENFECTCVLGWAGKTCNEDKQPPIASNCSNNIRVNATERSQFVYWTEPTFFDPMGSELNLVSNYETPNHTFPWGDFTIHYSATKIKNALRTECAFNITVRPTPCDLLPVPKNGTILCNDWSSDYGQFCVLACQRTFAPSLPGRLGTWMICGDDGKWSSQPSDCSLHLTNETNMLLYHPNYAEFMYERFNDYPRFREIYLNHMIKHKDISQFCKIYPGCDGSSSVRVYSDS